MLIGRPGVCPFLGIDFSKRLYFNIIGIHSKNLSIYRCQCFYYSIYAAISQENIIKHIRAETINQRVWQDIHPNISRVSKDLFCDGHFAAAAEIAIKEVETQMRILFKQYNPTAVDPKDAASLIGALLSENGLHKFCDTSNTSGRNYRKGSMIGGDNITVKPHFTNKYDNLDLLSVQKICSNGGFFVKKGV